MNIAFFMQPKATVAYLYDDFTVRQALEKMHHHGYTAIPVLNHKGEYVYTLSEGDLLWFIVRGEGGTERQIDIENLENVYLSDLKVNPTRYQTVSIAAKIDELLSVALNQNFIPVLDDTDSFIGIVTRRTVIKHFYDNTFGDQDTMMDDSK